MTCYQGISNHDMLSSVIIELIKKNNLEGKVLGDVILGSVMNHPFDWNLAREVVLSSNLSLETPGFNIQRACGTGLEAINLLALKIRSGQIECGIAGGSDTNSDIPLIGRRELSHWLIRLKTATTFLDKITHFKSFTPSFLLPLIPQIKEPRSGLSMGEHTELMVKDWNISRKDQDLLALESHQKASAAIKNGFYQDLVINFQNIAQDSITRIDTTLEKLSKLKPVFVDSDHGTLTAGNSTPLTDGASLVLLGSEAWSQNNDLEVSAFFTDYEVAAVDFIHGAGLLMAPTIAVSKLLKRNNLKLEDFDFYEIHEAFAGQVLCTLKAWEDPSYCKKVLGLDYALGSIDRSKINVMGGSIALGHPFAATGGRIIANAAKILKEKGKGRVLISICAAGGMGVAAIIER